jgi:CPA2 family monovalent cation:H+ antiporter-2
LLERAHIKHARLLIIAIPDALATRRIVDAARQIHPRIDIVARTESESERSFLRSRGASETVIGELELAIEMTRFSLHRFGVSSLEIQALARRLREPNQANAVD